MKKTTLSDFEAPRVVSNEQFEVLSSDYLDKQVINKITVFPLKRLEGNIDSKLGKDSVLIFLSGTGSMEVNGQGLLVTAGDVVEVKATEQFSVINPNLNAAIQFVSLFPKK